MGDLIGSFLVKLVPWIIPIVLVWSFLVNNKVTPPGRGGGNVEGGAKPQKSSGSQKVQAPPPQQEQLDAPLSDSDMTE